MRNARLANTIVTASLPTPRRVTILAAVSSETALALKVANTLRLDDTEAYSRMSARTVVVRFTRMCMDAYFQGLDTNGQIR